MEYMNCCGQKTIGLEVNFKKIAASFGFKFVRSCKTTTQLLKTLYEQKKNDCVSLK